ncbi:MAG: DUF4433 domain-containing protein [Clostridia bacterium]|nr:DUF4433 domain-containing protein [Clostridia bacterium]
MAVSDTYFSMTNRNYLYNITAIENIPSIMQCGILCYDEVQNTPHESIAMNDVQKRRDNIKVPDGLRLHSYANLYFDYHNPMLYKRQDMAEDICILALSIKVLDIDDCVVTDRNAATTLAKFYPASEGLTKLDFNSIFIRDWNDPDPYIKNELRQKKCSEVLVPKHIPFEYVCGANVVSESAKQKMVNLGFNKRIAVSSEVFYK